MFLPLWLGGQIGVHGQSKSNKITPHLTLMMAVANLRLLFSFTTARNREWILIICFQPPNSHNFNILNLTTLQVMQAIQQKHQQRNVDDLINLVKKVHQDCPLKTFKIILGMHASWFLMGSLSQWWQEAKVTHTCTKTRWLHESMEEMPWWFQCNEPKLQPMAKAIEQ